MQPNQRREGNPEMASDTTKAAVRREIKINARPETVYQFLTDPAKVTRWMGRMAVLEPRPGGAYRVVINDRDIASGKVVEAKNPERFVFTFGWESRDNPIRPGSSTVEITLERDGNGTMLRLVHTGLPADAVEDHGKGWQLYMGRLAVAAAGGDPGPDPNATPRKM